MARQTGKKKEIKGKESWRDLSITKKCAVCGKEYHPRNNSYQYTSKYCSQGCSRKGIKRQYSGDNVYIDDRTSQEFFESTADYVNDIANYY